jgi:hypothetical protein
MMNFKTTIFILTLSQLTMSVASASLDCEKKHKKATDDIIALVRTIPDKDFKNILLQGSDSGIDIFNLSSAQMDSIQNIAADKAPKFNEILKKPNCVSGSTKIEALKSAFNSKNYTSAVMILNGMKGLNGIEKTLDGLIAKAAPGPRVPVVADNTPPPDSPNADAGDSEVKTSTPPAHHYPNALLFRVDTDGIPIIDNDNPVVPRSGPFKYDRKKFGYFTPPQSGLTRVQWQKIFDGKATVVDGTYVDNSRPTRRCSFFVRTNCVQR